MNDVDIFINHIDEIIYFVIKQPIKRSAFRSKLYLDSLPKYKKIYIYKDIKTSYSIPVSFLQDFIFISDCENVTICNSISKIYSYNTSYKYLKIPNKFFTFGIFKADIIESKTTLNRKQFGVEGVDYNSVIKLRTLKLFPDIHYCLNTDRVIIESGVIPLHDLVVPDSFKQAIINISNDMLN